MEIKIVNCTTGEEIIRNATEDEIDNLEKSQADGQRQKAEKEARALAKAAAQAKLAALGLTVEDLQALGL
jgi:hypothetical protein